MPGPCYSSTFSAAITKKSSPFAPVSGPSRPSPGDEERVEQAIERLLRSHLLGDGPGRQAVRIPGEKRLDRSGDTRCLVTGYQSPGALCLHAGVHDEAGPAGGHLRRIGETLGLKRRPRDVTTLGSILRGETNRG